MHTDSNAAAAEVWADLFGLPKTLANRDHETAKIVSKLAEEYERGVELLMQRAQNQRLYESPVDLVRRGLTLRNFSKQWNGHVTIHFKGGALQSLLLAADLLPADEMSIPADDLQRIVDAVLSLQKAAEDSAMSDEFKHFLFRQVAILRRAIFEHELRGSAAFKDAINEAQDEILSNAAVVAAASETDEYSVLEKAWSATKQGLEVIRKWGPTAVLIGKGVTGLLQYAVNAGMLDEATVSVVTALLPTAPPSALPSGQTQRLLTAGKQEGGEDTSTELQQ